MTQIAQVEGLAGLDGWLDVIKRKAREAQVLRAMLREAHMCLAERAAETMPEAHDAALRALGLALLYPAQECEEPR